MSVSKSVELDDLLDNTLKNDDSPDTNQLYSYDEAIQLAGNGKFQIITFCTFAGCIISSCMSGTSMAFVLPSARCDLNISLEQQGLINSVGYIGIVLMSHAWGFMADSWGRRKVLLTSLMLTALFTLLSGFSLSSTMLFWTRLVVGLSSAAIQPSVIAYLSELTSNKHRLKYLSKASIFFASSFVIQAVINLLLTHWNFEYNFANGMFIIKPWRLFLMIVSALPLFCSIVFVYLPESPKLLLAQGKTDDCLTILKNVYAINTGKTKEDYPVKYLSVIEDSHGNFSVASRSGGASGSLKSVWSQIKPLFQQPNFGNMIMISTASFILYTQGYGLITWFPQIIAMSQKNVNISSTICEALSQYQQEAITSSSMNVSINATISNVPKPMCQNTVDSFTFMMTILIGVGAVILTSIVGFSLERIGKKKCLLTYLTFGACGTVAILFSNSFYMNILLLLLISNCSCIATTLYTITADIFPTQCKSMAISGIVLVARLASVVGSNICGLLLLNFCTITFNAIGISLIIAGLLAFVTLTRLENLKF